MTKEEAVELVLIRLDGGTVYQCRSMHGSWLHPSFYTISAQFDVECDEPSGRIFKNNLENVYVESCLNHLTKFTGKYRDSWKEIRLERKL